MLLAKRNQIDKKRKFNSYEQVYEEFHNQVRKEEIYHQYVHDFYNDIDREYLFFDMLSNVESLINSSLQFQYHSLEKQK